MRNQILFLFFIPYFLFDPIYSIPYVITLRNRNGIPFLFHSPFQTIAFTIEVSGRFAEYQFGEGQYAKDLPNTDSINSHSLNRQMSTRGSPIRLILIHRMQNRRIPILRIAKWRSTEYGFCKCRIADYRLAEY